MSKSILITGATGFLGSALAAALLRRGHRLFLLCRGGESRSPLFRAMEALERHGEFLPLLGDRLQIIEGDIADPLAGIRGAGAELLRGRIDAVVHCAALAKFSVDHERLMTNNVRGTEEAYHLAIAMGAREFHDVSTAYVAGIRQGRVMEDDLDCGQDFHNEYEHSKLLAERFLRSRTEENAPRLTVYRPGIIVGDSRTGMTMNYDNLYVYMRLLARFRREKGGASLRIHGNPAATKNLIPVDCVTDVIVRAIEQERYQGKTYHVVHPEPPTAGQLLEMTAGVLGIDRTKVAIVPEPFTPANRFEELLQARTSDYRRYMEEEPSFDTTNLRTLLDSEGIEVPPIDETLLRRLYRHALRTGWGRNSSASADGVTVYFTEYLPRFLHRQLIPSLSSLSTVIAIRPGGGRPWSVRIEKGTMTEIAEGDDPDVRASYTIDRATFLGIVRDEIAPQKAFFKGKIRIDGDILHGLKVAVVLGEFFHRYPWKEIGEEIVERKVGNVVGTF